MLANPVLDLLKRIRMAVQRGSVTLEYKKRVEGAAVGVTVDTGVVDGEVQRLERRADPGEGAGLIQRVHKNLSRIANG